MQARLHRGDQKRALRRIPENDGGIESTGEDCIVAQQTDAQMKVQQRILKRSYGGSSNGECPLRAVAVTRYLDPTVGHKQALHGHLVQCEGACFVRTDDGRGTQGLDRH